METLKFIKSQIDKLLTESDSTDSYTIDSNFYLYKNGKAEYYSDSKRDLIRYLKNRNPSLIGKLGLSEPDVPMAKKNKTIILYRGVGYNSGNNFYSPSKEFALEFTRTNSESELVKVKANLDRIYMHNPLPRGYGSDDENFDEAMKIAQNMGLNAIWVDEGEGQPNSVFKIDPNKKI